MSSACVQDGTVSWVDYFTPLIPSPPSWTYDEVAANSTCMGAPAGCTGSGFSGTCRVITDAPSPWTNPLLFEVVIENHGSGYNGTALPKILCAGYGFDLNGVVPYGAVLTGQRASGGVVTSTRARGASVSVRVARGASLNVDVSDHVVASIPLIKDSTSVPSQLGTLIGDAEPLKIRPNTFTIRKIGQTTTYPGAVNRIICTFAVNVPIEYGYGVTITGLRGTRTADAGGTTTVAQSIGTADTTIHVTSAAIAGLKLHDHSFVRIDNENMAVSDVIGNRLTVVRGQFGTTAGTHSVGATVTSVMPLNNEPYTLATGGIVDVTTWGSPRTKFQLDASASDIDGTYVGFKIIVTEGGGTESRTISSYIDRIVTIDTVTGSQLPWDATTSSTYVVQSMLSPVTSSFLAWNQTTGQLTISVASGHKLFADVIYSFSFDVKNPSMTQSPSISIQAGSASESLIQIEALMSDCCSVASQFPTMGETTLAASIDGTATTLSVASASTGKIVKDRYIYIEDEVFRVVSVLGNTVQVQRAIVYDIASGVLSATDPENLRTRFTLSGAGTTGASIVPFEYVGWDLSVKTQSNPEEIVRIVTYPGDFTVVIDRPLVTSPRAGVTNFAVRSTTKWSNVSHASGVKVYSILTGSVPGDKTALRVYLNQFVSSQLGQTNPFPAFINTLSITLSPNVDLQDLSAITLTGLSGAYAITGPITISNTATGYTHATLVSAYLNRSGSEQGVWDDDKKNLTLFLKSSLTAGEFYELSFQVYNPLVVQVSPAISIEARVGLRQVDLVFAGEGFIPGEIYAVGGGGYNWAQWCDPACGGGGFSGTFTTTIVSTVQDAAGRSRNIEGISTLTVTNEGFSLASEPSILAYYKSAVLDSLVSAVATNFTIESGAVAALKIVPRMQVKVDDEILLVNSVSGDRIFVTRGELNTNVTMHVQGARLTIYPPQMQNSITYLVVLEGGFNYAAGNIGLVNDPISVYDTIYILGGGGFMATYNVSSSGAVLESEIVLHRHGSGYMQDSDARLYYFQCPGAFTRVWGNIEERGMGRCKSAG